MFFAIAQCFGAFGSAWYGHLIGTGQDRNTLFVGYLVGAIAMILGGLTAVFFAVDAEGKSLEDVARPLSVIAKPSQAIFRAGGLRRRYSHGRPDWPEPLSSLEAAAEAPASDAGGRPSARRRAGKQVSSAHAPAPSAARSSRLRRRP